MASKGHIKKKQDVDVASSALPVVGASSVVDGFKWFIVVGIAALMIWGNQYFSDVLFIYRVIGLLVLTGLMLYVASRTVKGGDFLALARNSRLEMKRVVWPTRQEAMQTTLWVLLIVALSCFLFWLLDALIGFIFSLFLF